MSKIFFVRHGESVTNLYPNQGIREKFSFLTARGVNQAQLCGSLLKEHGYINFDYVLTSDLLRAKQTASIILEQIDKLYFMPQELEVWNEWKRYKGETLNDLDERVHKGLDFYFPKLTEIKDEHKPISLIVTHYHVMQSFFRWFKIDTERFWCGGRHIPNCGTFVYDYVEKNWTIFDTFNPGWVIYEN